MKKLKLINKSGEFVIKFNGLEYIIPSKVEFDIEETVGNHILFCAKKWDKNVSIIKKAEAVDIELPEIEIAEPIKVSEEEIKEVKEEIKKTKKVK